MSRVSENDVTVDNLSQVKHSKAGHLGDLNRKVKAVEEGLSGDVGVIEIESRMNDFEIAFRKFMSMHEQYMDVEVDAENRNQAIRTYEYQRDRRLRLQISVKGYCESRQVGGSRKLSLSRSGRSSGKSSSHQTYSDRSSVRERKRLAVAKVKLSKLKEKHALAVKEAQIKQQIEILEAETEVQVAEATVEIESEQSFIDERVDVCSQVFEGNSSQPFNVKVKDDGFDKPLKPQSKDGIDNVGLFDMSQLAIDLGVTSVSNPLNTNPITTCTTLHQGAPDSARSPPNISTVVQGRPSNITFPSSTQPVIHSPAIHTISNHLQPPVAPNIHIPPPFLHTPISAHVSPVVHSQVSHVLDPVTHTPYQHQTEQLSAWTAIADAIKQGPSLPMIELLKFNGDSRDYIEFVINFRTNIERKVADESQRLLHLIAQCTGRAKESIKSCVSLPVEEGYRRAWETLYENFGRPHMVADAQMSQLRDFKLKGFDAYSIMSFARQLEDVWRSLSSMGPSYSSRLDNEETLKMLMRKLSSDSLKRRWTERAGDLLLERGQVTFLDFLQFVKRNGERLNNVFGQELRWRNEDDRERRGGQRMQHQGWQHKATTLATQAKDTSDRSQKTLSQCSCCTKPHPIWRCSTFKSLPYQSKCHMVAQNKLCRRCLGKGHFIKFCDKDFTCRKEGCEQQHHTLLHPPHEAVNNSITIEERPSSHIHESETNPLPSPTSSSNLHQNHASRIIESEANVGATTLGRPRVCFKVVPVRVSSSLHGDEFVTHAFLDSGSDTTLCLESVAERLGLQGRKVSVCLSTVGGEQQVTASEVSLIIRGVTGESEFKLPRVLTTNRLPVDEKHVAGAEDLKGWPHLRGIHLPKTDDKEVTLLIGSDYPHIVEGQLDVRMGETNQPVAVKTPLGWTVSGPIKKQRQDAVTTNSLTCTQEGNISQQLQKLYDTEFGDSISDAENAVSVEDKKAKEIMEKSACLVNGHYQIKLPFRFDPSKLPDSLAVAKKRLDCLKRKMIKDTDFRAKYASVLKKYEEEGSSREVPKEELESLKAIWYLPHHAVWHPRKPGEPRVVFDCASKSKGVSLNDSILQGPENTSSLIGVIMRFRLHEIAVTGDIRRMFHQVFVPEEDRGCLCYLWWPDGDIHKEAKTFQMKVHLFGGRASSSVCGFALRRTAEDNKDDFSEDVIDAVNNNFYVDDLLISFQTPRQAVETTKDIKSLLERGGFNLTKIISNNRNVVQEFPVEERAPAVKELDLDKESLPTERALGVKWNVENDTFGLSVGPMQQPDTRRGVLSSIATIYDPLGLAGPLLLPGREINQDLCKRSCGWDNPLPEDICKRWNDWRNGLQCLENFSVDRCIKPKEFGKVSSAELHHFSDAAGEGGYGTASYIRLVNETGRVHCSFLYGKSRVKPLRPGITIPKMELTAATVLVSVNKMLMKELSAWIKIERVSFWTDSIIVLRYIANETKRFLPFVANRTAKIREGSNPSQWRYVSSGDNPADFASRGLRVTEREKIEMWTSGPKFLWNEEKDWPVQPLESQEELSESDEGVKKDKVIVSATVTELGEFWNFVFEKFSTFDKLRRVVAFILRAKCKFLSLLNKRNPGVDHCESGSGHLEVPELDAAEKRIFEVVQRQCFGETEFRKSGKVKGQLARLKPLIDGALLRVGGRLNHSNLDFEAKHPVILPAKHRITEMLILHYHFSNGHIGTQQLLAEMRQRFWVVSGVSSVRRVVRRCHECRRRNARVGEQITAPLPAVRVTSDSYGLIHPFSAVGIDLFGPLFVKKGRLTRSKKTDVGTEKRYGCIFTCLRYRAVHLEMVRDLSTDSFLNAVMRFISRRGPVRVLYSDNGSNFKGAEIDLIKALNTWDQERIKSSLAEKRITWNFNPPAASHQGGVWERLIRSTKKVLHAIIRERLVDEETLHTFLCEVEKILNDRPITRVPDDPEDLNVLTPNHILLLRGNPSTSPDEFQDLERYSARWKYAHILANQFWQRWIKEYLPTLQERQKWLFKRPNFRIGDLVLMVDQNVPRGQWNKAIIEETFPDIDGTVRQVLLRSKNGCYRRDIRKLCMLEENLIKSFEENNE